MKSLIKLKLLSLFVLMFVLTGCMSVKSFTGIVKNNLIESSLQDEPFSSKSIFLHTDKLETSDSIIKAKKLSSYFIPALVFWGWDKTIECQINKKYFISSFNSVLKQRVKEFQIEKYLGNKTLEISLESVPSDFVYSNNGTTIFLLVFYTYTYLEAIYPANQELIMSYKLLEGDKVLKTKVFRSNFSETVINYDFSTKHFLNDYIATLTREFDYQSGQFIDKILEDF